MATGTDNQPGSTDPRDLYANAQNLDLLLLGPQPFYPDRLGVQRYSWAGMEFDFNAAQSGRQTAFQQFLTGSGFEAPVSYASGITLERVTQTFVRDNVQYRIKDPADLPYTLTGNWATESDKFASMGDSGLRQDLAGSDGANQVGYSDDETYAEGTVGSKLKEVVADVSGVAPLILKFKDQYHMADWQIEGAPDYQTAAPNEGAKLQQAFDDVSSVSGTLIGDAKNYLTDRQLVVDGNFRSFKLQGPGTGNSQTASTGGMTLMTNGLYSAIRAEMNVFANENIRIEGVNFYNIARGGLAGSALYTLLASAGPAIKVVHGASSARYHSGFVFRDVGIVGYGAGIDFQGLNTADAGLNFFGTVIGDNVSMTDVGYGYLIANASLNLLDLRSPLLHNCPFGGLVLIRDGEVGSGNGRGSSVNCHIGGKPHFEGVGGMFRTQTTRTYGGTGTSEVLRSTITIEGLRHEFCGDTINSETGVPTGDPFALGVDTDLIIIGDVNYGMGYQEVAYGAIPASCTVTSSTPVRLNLNGGRSLSPRMINAPVISRTIANGASTTFTLTASQVDRAYALKSQLLLSGGQAGFIESMHRGMPNGGSGAKSTTSVGSPISGVTVTFGPGSSGDVVSCVVANTTGFTISAELQIENLSGCTILTPSEF